MIGTYKKYLFNMLKNRNLKYINSYTLNIFFCLLFMFWICFRYGYKMYWGYVSRVFLTLVGGIPTPLKNMKVEWKVIKFHGSKPLTRFLWLFPKISKFPGSFLQGAGCDVDIASVPRFWWWPFPVILGCRGPHRCTWKIVCYILW